MSEWQELAEQATAYLKPYLLAAGGKVAGDALQAGSRKVAEFYDWLKSQLTGPTAAAVIQELDEEPGDETNWQTLALQLQKRLQQDETFRQELCSRLPSDITQTDSHQTQTLQGNDNVQIQSRGDGGNFQINQS